MKNSADYTPDGRYYSDYKPCVEIAVSNLCILDYFMESLESMVGEMVKEGDYEEVEEAAGLLNQIKKCAQKLEEDTDPTNMDIESIELEVHGDDKPMSEL